MLQEEKKYISFVLKKIFLWKAKEGVCKKTDLLTLKGFIFLLQTDKAKKILFLWQNTYLLRANNFVQEISIILSSWRAQCEQLITE